MVAKSWKQNAVIDKLLKEPGQFDFFQALSLLEHTYYQNNLLLCNPLVFSSFIKFTVSSKNKFPVSQIEALSQDVNLQAHPTFKVQVTFLGLTGVRGALPAPYTEKLLVETYQGNFALRDFLDIFNHRTLTLFYQAWKKNHFSISYGFKPAEKQIDPFTNSLEHLSGLASSLDRLKIFKKREIASLYASLWGRSLRSASLLERLLSEYFELPIQILPFQGRWLFLNPFERSKLATLGFPQGQYQQLGVNVILGGKKWDVQSKFRVYIGPLDYHTFEKLSLWTELSKTLIQMVTIYIPPELSFDIEIELLAEAVPPCKLEQKSRHCLGWNAWLHSQPFRQNARAILRVNGE